jgi:hypothetical protein
LDNATPLHKAMKKRGYEFRQHLEEQSWGWHEPTVVDMNTQQRDALKHGGAQGLKEFMNQQLYRPAWGLWTFPAMDIEELLPIQPDLVLAQNGCPATVVVAPQEDEFLWSCACEWVESVKGKYAVDLQLQPDTDATPDLLDKQHLIVFGGAHQNRLALALALRYRTFFLDASVPGEDGYAVATHTGIHKSGHNVMQVVASREHWATVKELMLNGVVTDEETAILRHIHQIKHGEMMTANFPAWEAFTAGLPSRLPQLKEHDVDVPTDIQALADLLALGFNSGGREGGLVNNGPIDIANDCARYYQLSRDARALTLFRELLFRLADYYLKTPGGASYPADLDFRLGLLILNYARVEHESIFTKADRLLLVNLLLACTRSIYEYAMKFWPCDGSKEARHNHETFPALSLAYAADYFRRFDLPYVQDWLAYAEVVFSGGIWNRSKQCENSRSYEPFVFEHAAAYSAFTGRGLSLFSPGCFEKMVRRQIVATDNFFRAVDYGDTAIRLNPVDSVSARMLATQESGITRWFATAGFERKPDYVPPSFLDYPGIRQKGDSASSPDAGNWEYVPTDAAFMRDVAPSFPPEFSFDKLAFRTGWEDDDQYVLLEGIGCGVSHGHNDVNGIVRYNHLGRHWIVSNGYGRRIGTTSAMESFRTRVLGPEDHNLLVLQRDGEIVRDMPMNAMLQRGSADGLLYTTCALLGYGGVNWFRTLIVNAGRYLLVLDRIQAVEPGLEQAHIEWNCLGSAHPNEKGFRLEQKGVFLDVLSDSQWPVEQGVADQSRCWHAALNSGEYPYASFPLTKLIYTMPHVDAGETTCLATLLAASESERPFSITQPGSGHIVIEGLHDSESDVSIEDGDLSIQVQKNLCQIKFAHIPEIPPALQL